MKHLPMAVFTLLVMVCGSGAVADGNRKDGGHAGEWPVAASQGGESQEEGTRGTLEKQRRGDANEAGEHRDRDEHGDRGRDGGRDRPPGHNRIIAVPIVVPQGYYDYAPANVEQPPQYIEEDGNYYWYYCPNLGYYPNVQVCPDGWLKVVPNSP